MMFQSGKAYSLLDLGQKFLAFAQDSNANTQAWELVDNRLSTFYGATFRIPMNNWKDVNDNKPYFYISLQHTNITGGTYCNYLDTIASGVDNTLEAKHYLNTEGAGTVYEDANWTYYHYSKYGAVNNINIFRNSGELIAISPHTLFDENLWMCEQGGTACFRPSEVDAGADQNLIYNYVNCYPKHSGTEYTKTEPNKLFPGSGTPWITISNQNKTDYLVNECGMDYWFLKTDYMAIITYRLTGGRNEDLYQSIAFGSMINARETSYMFPLFVAGGTQALSQDILVYTPLRQRCPTNVAGNVYDLDMQNIAMANSNLLHPTMFNGATATNFRVLSPQGLWKSITAHTQGASVVSYYYCQCSPTCGTWDFGYPLSDVSHDLSLTGYHTMFPKFGRDARNIIDTYCINKKYTHHEYSSPLQKVLVFLNENQNYTENGCMGIIPNVYSSWYRDLPCGEVIIGGKRYLSVPNGWEHRLYKYPTKVGVVVNDEWQNSTVLELYGKLLNSFRNYQISDRLLIPLEEGAWS